jgi:hypothetical protein
LQCSEEVDNVNGFTFEAELYVLGVKKRFKNEFFGNATEGSSNQLRASANPESVA